MMMTALFFFCFQQKQSLFSPSVLLILRMNLWSLRYLFLIKYNDNNEDQQFWLSFLPVLSFVPWGNKNWRDLISHIWYRRRLNLTFQQNCIYVFCLHTIIFHILLFVSVFWSGVCCSSIMQLWLRFWR